jgi:hypothetical protein
MSFVEQLTVSDTDTLRDLTPYNEVLDLIKVGQKGSVVVPTGELVTEGSRKGKGKTACEHERGFREAAKERKIGMNIRHVVLGEQTRLIIVPKAEMRTFTPEQIKTRTEALRKARLKKNVDKYMLEHHEATREVALKAVQETEKVRAATTVRK